jgi:hypothetical protein
MESQFLKERGQTGLDEAVPLTLNAQGVLSVQDYYLEEVAAIAIDYLGLISKD